MSEIWVRVEDVEPGDGNWSNNVANKAITVQEDAITVDINGDGDYTSIQAAIDNATEGETIRVWAGTYEEEIMVNTTLSLIGNGSTDTTIKGSRGLKTNTVIVNADHCNISGFNITDGGRDNGDAGLKIFSDWNTIQNNNISNNGEDGLSIIEADHNLIDNNIMNSHKERGIVLDGANNNTISNLTCAYNTYGAIVDHHSNFNRIINSDFSNNEHHGVYLSDGSYNNTLDNLTIKFIESGNGIIFESNVHDNKIINSTITDELSDRENLNFASNSMNNVAINTVFSTITCDETSSLLVKNYLVVQVLSDTAPLAGADVRVRDNPILYASSHYGGINPKTGVDGKIRPLLVTDRIYDGNSNATENTTTVEVYYQGNSVTVDVNMSIGHTELVYLDLFGVSPSSDLYYPHDTVSLTASLNQTSPANLTFTVLDPAGNALPQAAANLTTELHQRPLAADEHTVGLWHFDDAWGPTAADGSGEGNDGELAGGPEWVEGKLGKALEISEDTGPVNIEADPSLNFAGPITVEAWVRINAIDEERQRIVAKWENWESSNYNWILGTDNFDDYRFLVKNVGDPIEAVAPNSVEVGKWQHVMGVWNGTDTLLYVDGELVNMTEGPNARKDSDFGIGIGDSYNETRDILNGTSDEVRISDIARDISESQLYQRAQHSFRLGPRAAPGNYTVYANVTAGSGNEGGGSATTTFEVGALQAVTDREWYYQGENITAGAEYYDVNATNVTWELLDPEGEVVTTVADVRTSIDGWEYEADENTVGLWHFDEGYGDTAYDSSDEGNDGTLENGLTLNSGVIGMGLIFDGQDDYLEVPHHESIDFEGNDTFSIEFWFKRFSLSVDQQRFLVKGKGGDPENYAYDVRLYAENSSLSFMWESDNGQINQELFGPQILDLSWHHVATSWDGGSQKIYLDGFLVAEDTSSQGPGTDADRSLIIGGHPYFGGSDYFNGTLDEIRIINSFSISTQFNLFQSASSTMTLPASAAPGQWTLRATAADGALVAAKAIEVRPMLALGVPAGPGEGGSYTGGDAVNASAELYRGGAENLTFVLLDPEGQEVRNITVTGELGGWAYEADDATVGLWHFDEGDGDVAYDSSGNDINGEINETQWIDGRFDSTLYFDGDGDFID